MFFHQVAVELRSYFAALMNQQSDVVNVDQLQHQQERHWWETEHGMNETWNHSGKWMNHEHCKSLKSYPKVLKAVVFCQRPTRAPFALCELFLRFLTPIIATWQFVARQLLLFKFAGLMKSFDRRQDRFFFLSRAQAKRTGHAFLSQVISWKSPTAILLCFQL